VREVWDRQGCAVCRGGWESGSRTGLRDAGASDVLHARLYQCEICRSYWQEREGVTHEISLEEADALQQHPSFMRDAHTG
jgi:hypothetical protein